MVELYFDDIIEVDRLDPDGKKYDKGKSHISCQLIIILILLIKRLNKCCNLYKEK